MRHPAAGRAGPARACPPVADPVSAPHARRACAGSCWAVVHRRRRRFLPCRTIMPMSQTVDASRIPELADTIALALETARTAGATQAEADVSLQQGLSVTVRLGEVETVEYQRDRGLGITVYFNGAKGSASSADLRPAAVRDMVAKAVPTPRTPAPTESAALANAPNLAADTPDPDLYPPWASPPSRPSNWRANARQQAGRWTAGWPIPRVPRWVRIAAY